MQDALVSFSNSLAAAVERAARAVAAVEGRSRFPSSGIHLRREVIVTADHTVRRDEDLRVTLPNGKTVEAQLAGRDPSTDLAVLKVPGLEAPAAQFREEANLRAGDVVLAVGRSPEHGPTAALGLVSAASGAWRTWRGGSIEQLLRIDGALHPGTSGGAIVDAEGRIAGLATAGLTRTSPIAIPLVTLHRVVRQILDHGHVARGFLGVGLQAIALPEAIRARLGRDAARALIVLNVEANSPAAHAGVLIGDIFLTLNGAAVTDPSDIQALLGAEQIGKTIAAEVLRGGEPARLSLTVGERSAA